MKNIFLILYICLTIPLFAQYPVIDGEESYSYIVTDKSGKTFTSSVVYRSEPGGYSYSSISPVDQWDVFTDENGLPSRIRLQRGDNDVLLVFDSSGNVTLDGIWENKKIHNKASYDSDVSLENAMLIRTMNLDPGSRRVFDILHGDKFPRMKSYTMCFQVEDRTSVTVPAGTFSCVKVLFTLDGAGSAFFRSYYYVTDDDRRIIVKMDNIPPGGNMELQDTQRTLRLKGGGE